eukprot:SAG31_NODE_35346_length_324_cov_0.693333_1_plen_29_part_01
MAVDRSAVQRGESCNLLVAACRSRVLHGS